MSNFPAIQNHSDLQQAVNARELHSYLEISRDFSTWINGRIDQFNFSQGEDFMVDAIPQNGGKGGRPLMAKRYDKVIEVNGYRCIDLIERVRDHLVVDTWLECSEGETSKQAKLRTHKYLKQLLRGAKLWGEK